MCEFCSKHKRKKWFLDPDSYNEKLLENKKRKNVLQKIAKGWEYYMRDAEQLARLSRTPVIGSLSRSYINNQIKYEHAGQVVSLGDALQIIDLADNHVVFECACRKLVGLRDKMCCVNLGPMKELSTRISEKKHEFDVPELKLKVKEWAHEGLFPQVLYATAPYPIALCMCERKYCVSAKYRFIFGYQTSLLKGHEVAVADPTRCKCEAFPCITRCQFGAMYVDRYDRKVVVDPTRCFGCGLCAVECKFNAISLKNREDIPAARGKW